MKTKIISIVVMLLMAANVMAQDYMRVYFKDGIYKEFYLEGLKEWKVSQYDADGVKHADYKYQHIKTNFHDFVFDLEKIDSIVFTKFDEEKAFLDFKAAMISVLSVLSENATIEGVEPKLDLIKNSESVEDAWCSGHVLSVDVRNLGTINFYLYEDIVYDEETDETIALAKQMKEYIPQFEQMFSQDGRKPSIVVANQNHYDLSRTNRLKAYEKVLDEFGQCGFDTTYMARPTIDFFASEMYDYDLILFISHGGYNEKTKSHSFLTGEFLGSEVPLSKEAEPVPSAEFFDNCRKRFHELYETYKYVGLETVKIDYSVEEGESGKVLKGYPIIHEDFFGEGGPSQGTFRPNSIFFNGCCQTFNGETDEIAGSFAQKFVNNHGLRLFWGYRNNTHYSPWAGCDYFRSLLYGQSTRKAYDELKSQYKEEWLTAAKLYKYTKEDDTGIFFLSPTITTEKDSETATLECYMNNFVSVNGYTTSLDYNKIKCGFLYSINKDLSAATNVIVKSPISRPNTDGKGNVVFRYDIEELHPGITYYYCAYTYDGSDYNCGDTLSFSIEKIPDLTLSAQEITLDARTTKTVEITSGSGYYTVSVDEPTIAAASCDGSVITIKGLKEDTAIVTVEDKVSHKTAAIKVTVNAPDPSAYMKTFTVNGVSFTMVNVEGATYYMGKNTYDYDAANDEYPRHLVSLSNYYIGQTEVTQELWTAVMGSNPSKFTDSDQLPVDRVSWEDCQDFVAKLNELTGEKFRLPTEAEWEFAARGGMKSKGYKYSGSDNIDEVAWYKENAGDAPHPVATKAPNELGLYDMSGNTMEWVYDWYGNYKSTAQVNPTGPSSGTDKVERGGSWFNPSNYCRNSARFKVKITDKYSNLGLRLAQSSSDERLDEVFPEEILEKMEKHMPIFDGTNPPNIEGEYLGSPWVVQYDETNSFEVGHAFADTYHKFYNQDMVNNTLDYREKQANTETIGTGTLISGDGTHFTVYFDTEGVSTFDDYNVTYKTALVISGTKTTSGIGNMFYGFVLLEKSDDPNHHVMEAGFCRVLKDQDGSSPYYNWYGGNAPKRVPGYDWSLPGMLWNKP